MKIGIVSRTKEYIFAHKFKKRWHNVVAILAAIVVFGTVYALILPAVTLEYELVCECEEHQHSDACYEEALAVLQCEVKAHEHADECFDEENNLICGFADFMAHSHNEFCYNSVNELSCTLTEIPPHTHSEECYSTMEEPTTDDSLAEEPLTEEEFDAEAVLICEEEECILHTHEEECFDEEEVLICEEIEILEHNHSEECMVEGGSELVCGKQEHFHEEILCYAKEPNVGLFSISSSAVSGNVIAQTTAYDAAMFSDTNLFVVYTESNGRYYAFDGNGNAVEIRVDADGDVLYDGSDPNILLWSFTLESGNSYVIKNESTGRYMHAYPNNGTGVTTSGAYTSTIVVTGSTVKIRSNSEYATLNVSSGKYEMTQNQSKAASYEFAVVSRGSARASQYTVWLDGTNGLLMSLQESPDKKFAVVNGSRYQLPQTWESHGKYNYVLRGWYDVRNSKYYAPGDFVTVTQNMVFYADWEAATYDVGQFNEHVADTVSTNSFITTKVFDYGHLFNVQSANADVTVSSSSHEEKWNIVTKGNVNYQNGTTLNYIFRDYDYPSKGKPISLPANTNGNTANNSQPTITSGLYTNTLGDLLFNAEKSFDPDTKTGVIGMKYVGNADHLFQIETDPNSEHRGYYYYDSKLNAASYNQTDQRFYVYDYLERTSDSRKDGGDGEFSDFLPFNSPYITPQGQILETYSYDGKNGEYSGTTHYMYDAKYNKEGSVATNVGTNYLFGMSLDIEFYLPDNTGTGGNLDIYGQPMEFEFSGDDDVWVFVDGKLVLDVGGMHGIKGGDINFSTGKVTTEGTVTDLPTLSEGDHVLTVYYLERGSSQSNCAIYFNLVPRFDLTIQKEDVLSQELLNGAEFSIYMDRECETPAKLWVSKEAYENDTEKTNFKNVITIENGVGSLWGFSPGKTYYIKETQKPSSEDYDLPSGIIQLTLDQQGTASYSVEMLPDAETKVSEGFGVYGFKINEETQQAYIVITNAPNWVKSVVSFRVTKEWNDTKDHKTDSATIYLTVTDPDGTVRRIREVVLNADNNWTTTWTGLPEYERDGTTPIQYGVEEAYQSGYSYNVTEFTGDSTTQYVWVNVANIDDGGVYLLKTSKGYLSTKSSSDSNLQWVTDISVAKSSNLAQWTATKSGEDTYTFTNGANQKLTYYQLWDNRYFYATTQSGSRNLYVPESQSGIYIQNSDRTYYISSAEISNGHLSATADSGLALMFSPMRRITNEIVTDKNFIVTNTPLERSTAVAVEKRWNADHISEDLYLRENVTVKLLANGKDTGRTVTLNLQNGWRGTFQGLPYEDDSGNIISYTLEEVNIPANWIPTYQISTVSGSGSNSPTYQAIITNSYYSGIELPATGGSGTKMLMIGGTLLIIISALLLCRNFVRERRYKDPSAR